MKLALNLFIVLNWLHLISYLIITLGRIWVGFAVPTSLLILRKNLGNIELLLVSRDANRAFVSIWF